MNTFNDFIKDLPGITNYNRHYNTDSYSGHRQCWLKDDSKFELPTNIHIEFLKTAATGSIGRLVDIEFKKGSAWYDVVENEINPNVGTFIVQFDGRSKPSRLTSYHGKILFNHAGPTSYVRNVKKTKKVKNPVNKYKQELQKGDWVIGVKKGSKALGIGRVTRWTEHNVWAVFGEDLKDKSKEFQFNGILDTFLIPPGTDIEPELTMAVLKGWKGQ